VKLLNITSERERGGGGQAALTLPLSWRQFFPRYASFGPRLEHTLRQTRRPRRRCARPACDALCSAPRARAFHGT